MDKQVIETRESLRGLITVESINGGRDVIVYIREARNEVVTAEASIRISPESLFDLVLPITGEVADQLKLEGEMI